MKALAAIVAVASVTQGPAAIVMNVTIAANGVISVDGHEVRDENAVADRARDALRKTSDVRAVIAADKSVTYGRVVAVMDALKRGGVTRIAFAVGP